MSVIENIYNYFSNVREFPLEETPLQGIHNEKSNYPEIISDINHDIRRSCEMKVRENGKEITIEDGNELQKELVNAGFSETSVVKIMKLANQKLGIIYQDHLIKNMDSCLLKSSPLSLDEGYLITIDIEDENIKIKLSNILNEISVLDKDGNALSSYPEHVYSFKGEVLYDLSTDRVTLTDRLLSVSLPPTLTKRPAQPRNLWSFFS